MFTLRVKYVGEPTVVHENLAFGDAMRRAKELFESDAPVRGVEIEDQEAYNPTPEEEADPSEVAPAAGPPYTPPGTEVTG